MLSSSIRRAARSSIPFSGVLPSVSVSASANGYLSTTSQRKAHQRRYSSSKPPAPPSDGSRPFDTSSQSATGKSVGPAEQNGERKAAKRKAKDNNARNGSDKSNQPAAFLNVPSVPSTRHLSPEDMYLASFFSLHRPISVNTAIPPTTNGEAVNAILETQSVSRRGSEDVIDTLSSAVRSLEHATGTQASVNNPEVNVIHLDSVSEEDVHNSIGEIAKRLAPFNPPPAPTPYNEESLAAEDQAAHQEESSMLRTYTTVLTIRESVLPDGQKTYDAHVSPLVREDMEAPGTDNVESALDEEPNMNSLIRKSYIERVYNDKMQAISVRRQRKLKMKKHKFKKLLRKTRTLRRKLDKA